MGIHIPNQKNQVKISQYADNSNFFLKKQESVNNVLPFFQNLRKATGTTINLEKNTVFITNKHRKHRTITKNKPKNNN